MAGVLTRSVMCLAGGLALCSCAVLAGDPAEPAARPSPVEVAVAFVAAYNARDVERVLALSAADITWLSIEGDRTEVVARGRQALGDALRDYFAEFVQTRSEIDAAIGSGAFVATRERAIWQRDDEQREQTSLAIYEICAASVCRIWYYPAVYGAQ